MLVIHKYDIYILCSHPYYHSLLKIQFILHTFVWNFFSFSVTYFWKSCFCNIVFFGSLRVRSLTLTRVDFDLICIFIQCYIGMLYLKIVILYRFNVWINIKWYRYGKYYNCWSYDYSMIKLLDRNRWFSCNLQVTLKSNLL